MTMSVELIEKLARLEMIFNYDDNHITIEISCEVINVTG